MRSEDDFESIEEQDNETKATPSALKTRKRKAKKEPVTNVLASLSVPVEKRPTEAREEREEDVASTPAPKATPTDKPKAPATERSPSVDLTAEIERSMATLRDHFGSFHKALEQLPQDYQRTVQRLAQTQHKPNQRWMMGAMLVSVVFSFVSLILAQSARQQILENKLAKDECAIPRIEEKVAAVEKRVEVAVKTPTKKKKFKSERNERSVHNR